jgi:hypothetical protein
MIPVRCIFGMAGHGKTTLARQLVAGERRLLAWDPDGEHDVLRLQWDDFCAFMDREPATFRVGLQDDDDLAEHFCAVAWELGAERASGTRLVVLMEEADEVAIPGQEPPIVKRLIRRGRHHGIEVVACSRRPAEVSRRLTSQARELYLFSTQEPKDLTYLRTFVGPEPTEAVAQLGRFEYVHWTRGEGWITARTVPPGGAITASCERADQRKTLAQDSMKK